MRPQRCVLFRHKTPGRAPPTNPRTAWGQLPNILGIGRARDGGGAKRVAVQDGASYTPTGCCAAGCGENIMKCLSCLFVVAMLASPESTISNAHANTSFDGAWSVQITMDQGHCDPINRLTVDIRDGAMQYTGDSAVSIQGQVLSDGQVRVRLTHGDHRVSGSGRLSASSGTGTWHGTGLASAC